MVKAAPPPGGSEVGWTFYSTFITCPRKWFLRYVEGLAPVLLPEALVIGIIYHALHEGKSEGVIKSWGPQFVELFPRGHQVYVTRTKKGAPPLPKARDKERPVEVTEGMLKGMYTARLDRVEGTADAEVIREFKTATSFKNTDSDFWAIHGEIVGQMVCSGLDEVTVDITTKGENGSVSQLTVCMDDRKRKTWENLVFDIIRQIKNRLLEADDFIRGYASRSRNDIAEAAFPRYTKSCIDFGRHCEFYQHCWGTGSSKHLYTHSPKDGWRKRLGIPMTRFKCP